MILNNICKGEDPILEPLFIMIATITQSDDIC